MNTMPTRALLAAGLACLVPAAAPAALAAEDGPRYFTFYAQQAWPKQTNTNAQIQQINDTFGTDFEDWSDVANLSVGAHLFWRVSPHWKVGMQVDYSRGSIDGSEKVMTEAGKATLSFEQEYSVYADLYAVAHFLPWPEWKMIRPFVYGGVGVGYESDTTTLDLENQFIDAGLRVENDGWFPTYTAGIGMDVPFSQSTNWYFEVGVAYVWSRMTNEVPATGALAPAPEVTADTDFTGPNYWLGVGLTF